MFDVWTLVHLTYGLAGGALAAHYKKIGRGFTFTMILALVWEFTENYLLQGLLFPHPEMIANSTVDIMIAGIGFYVVVLAVKYFNLPTRPVMISLVGLFAIENVIGWPVLLSSFISN